MKSLLERKRCISAYKKDGRPAEGEDESGGAEEGRDRGRPSSAPVNTTPPGVALAQGPGAHSPWATPGAPESLSPRLRSSRTPRPASCLHTSSKRTRPARTSCVAARPGPIVVCAPPSAPPPPRQRTGSPPPAPASPLHGGEAVSGGQAPLDASTMGWLQRHVLEMLSRLAVDSELLGRTLFHGAPVPVLAGVLGDLGDPHGGRSVAVLQFEGGLHAVYKPKDLRITREVQAFCAFLNERGLPLSLHVRGWPRGWRRSVSTSRWHCSASSPHRWSLLRVSPRRMSGRWRRHASSGARYGGATPSPSRGGGAGAGGGEPMGGRDGGEASEGAHAPLEPGRAAAPCVRLGRVHLRAVCRSAIEYKPTYMIAQPLVVKH
ncbi:DUF4135 domain-containing protein [Cystobacter ferrugineus]|uniref:DUF4135 domain-containing protein n=1 Tax=Cystobacter ferrugineus TaxID=83449 RepID=UPI000A6210E7